MPPSALVGTTIIVDPTENQSKREQTQKDLIKRHLSSHHQGTWWPTLRH